MSDRLEPLTLPAADATGPWLVAITDAGLDEADALAQQLRGMGDASAVDVLQTWNHLQRALGGAAAAAGLMSEVHPDAAVRESADEAERRIDTFSTDLGLDPELYAVFADLDADGLDADATRLLDHVLRDFRRSGVDRDEPTRDRLRELARLELEASQEFGRNIREGTRTIQLRPEQLEGLPQDWIDAHAPGDDGLVAVTTDYPDSVPVRTFARDRAAREAITEAALTVAWPDNDAVLRRLLELRAEHAQLLGYADWADYDAEVKMIGSASAISDFIERISSLAGPSAERDKAALLDRLRVDQPDATDVDGADATFLSEAVRRESYDVDAQEVRRYFSFPAVRQGLLDITGELLGLTWEPVEATTWAEDVTAYDVLLDGERIGRIYLDLHPREGKFKHAAQFTLVSGIAGEQLPEGVLVCNLARGLMEHDEVVTLFHEFGHLVHHILAGRQQWARFSGVATEWDFVEAPSQLLEEWAWDPAVLATFAKDSDGTAIPAELVARMRAGDDFGKGFQARTQMFYAAVSLSLHRELPEDITARIAQLQRTYSVIRALPGTHMHCSFGHLSGYASAYYTYMWSLVIAKDLFSAFDPQDLMAEQVARRYRESVLEPGGSRDAADLVESFLGRPYTFDAYADWLSQEPRRDS